MSALRRNFFSAVDPELRTVEHTLTYLEAAMRGYVRRVNFANYLSLLLFYLKDMFVVAGGWYFQLTLKLRITLK